MAPLRSIRLDGATEKQPVEDSLGLLMEQQIAVEIHVGRQKMGPDEFHDRGGLIVLPKKGAFFPEFFQAVQQPVMGGDGRRQAGIGLGGCEPLAIAQP